MEHIYNISGKYKKDEICYYNYQRERMRMIFSEESYIHYEIPNGKKNKIIHINVDDLQEGWHKVRVKKVPNVKIAKWPYYLELIHPTLNLPLHVFCYDEALMSKEAK